MSIAITEVITTLVEAERWFNLARTEAETFFPHLMVNPLLQEIGETIVHD